MNCAGECELGRFGLQVRKRSVSHPYLLGQLSMDSGPGRLCQDHLAAVHNAIQKGAQLAAISRVDCLLMDHTQILYADVVLLHPTP